MIILPVRSVYTTTHCTYKGTMMAYREPHRNDIITPGASTVAKFKTIMTLNLRDSKLSQTKRQVNAFIYIVPLPTDYFPASGSAWIVRIRAHWLQAVSTIAYRPKPATSA